MLQRQQPERIIDTRCHFCSKEHHQVEHLIAGVAGLFICKECVELCRKMLEEQGMVALFGAESPLFLFCHSCSARCRRTDSYCFHCGQRLEQRVHLGG
jgi:hypothetical protein